MLIGYAWVSGRGKPLTSRKRRLTERASTGSLPTSRAEPRVGRRQLDHAFSQLRPGDILVVLKLDRLGRSVQHLIATVKYLNRRGIGFRSLQGEHRHDDGAWASSCSTRLAEPWLSSSGDLIRQRHQGPTGRESPSLVARAPGAQAR